MDKRRIVFVVMLVVALGVLVWDKTSSTSSLTNPQPSQAKTPLAPAPTGGLKPAVAAPSSAPPAHDPAPSSGEEATTDAAAGVEADRWTVDDRSRRQAEDARQQWRNLFDQEAQADLVLTATVKMPGMAAARINDRTLSVGEAIGPYRLVTIEDNHVVMESKQGRFELYLDSF